ncbi:hypothetical protein LCGC14_2903620 [marine sediment metagenome]|uniref:Uncharacterized protein n=1 Tax=marine sediment metagenome TaxID=412755 RepID=A0A0F9A1H3_9ZZZZ
MIQTLPRSVATRKDKPVAAYYATMVLSMFTTYTRALFRRVFETQAPPFDPATPYIKAWWDSEATGPDDDPYVYDYVDRASTPLVLRVMTITQKQARETNIPGKYHYPAYAITPTRAYVAGPDGNPINLVQANRLSHEREAFALLDDLNHDVPGLASVVGESTLDGTFFKVVYKLDDPKIPEMNFREVRRLYQIELTNGGSLNVGRIMKRMAADGRGSPGHFEARGNDPIWVSDVTLEDPVGTLAVLPTPARDLDDDEELVNLGIGGIPSVKRYLGDGDDGGGSTGISSDDSKRMLVILEAVAEALHLDV